MGREGKWPECQDGVCSEMNTASNSYLYNIRRWVDFEYICTRPKITCVLLYRTVLVVRIIDNNSTNNCTHGGGDADLKENNTLD
jgi:hypothetical protein